MASNTIPNLDDAKNRLRVSTDRNGRAMEEEPRLNLGDSAARTLKSWDLAYYVFVTSRSVPLALGVPPERFGESSGSGGSVDGGRNGAQHEHQMRCNNEAIVSEDQLSERREILEARTTDEDG